MYLKKIETQGFKSFANKMVLEFRPGIMGIVGPNGSGKSNVADAVRWVLGEQSAKQLRGSNMQDIIFAGTENRKPQGYAYVELTIDNADHMLAVDYDEVVVSRRVYRSGESEYRMNGSICRLRDILELFYDTGVGKEGYSIIGQGQIDRILSGKPEDRRELFDEAAGIVKFKKRKHITMKKLEAEESNLARVTDILRELERRVGPLEKEAEKARQYLRIREELKQADIRSFCMENEDFDRRLEEFRQRQAIVEAAVTETREEAERVRLGYEKVSRDLAELEAAMEQDRRVLMDTGIHRQSLEGELALIRQKIAASLTDEEKVRDRIRSLGEQAEDRLGQIEAQRAMILHSDEENREQKEQLDRERKLRDESQEELHRLEAEIADLQRQQLEALEEKAKISADLQRTITMIGTISERSARILEQLSGSRDEGEGLETQIRDKSRRLADARQRLEKVRRERKDEQQAILQCEEEQRANSQAMGAENQSYLSVKSHRESLIRLMERYEGYNNSTRKVMEQRENNPGILGVVADLFHTDQKYETALEIALGGRIQNIVTDTEETARDMITFLKNGKQGRATFLPLSGIQVREGFPRPEACREKGALGIASELVQTEPRFRPVAGFLLGRTLVVDNMEHALAIARKYRHSLNLVTLEGDSFTPGGAMTGGSSKGGSNNLLGRKREIEQMKARQDQIQGRLDELRRQARMLEDRLRDKRYLMDQLQEREHETELEINTLSMEIASLKEQHTSLTQGRAGWKSEREDLLAQLSLWNQRKAEGESLLAAVADAEAQREETIDGQSLRLEAVKDENLRCLRRLEKLRGEMTAYEQLQAIRRETIEHLEEEHSQLAEEAEALEQGLSGGDEMRRAEEARQEELRLAMEEDEKTITDMEQRVSLLSEKKDRLTGEQHRTMERYDELHEKITELETDRTRIQNSLENLDEKQDKLTRYLWDEYNMTPSEAEKAAARWEPVSQTEARRRVTRAKAEIRELGPVNVNAIEEFREVGERYTFIKAQHEDLVRGAEQLQDIIRELDTGMRRQFREKFAQIKEEFNRVFRELFGGGKGDLELGEAEDILDAGILINAQPPGKKLQNMMQLSGGEKALSAIALLFAIQNLKPSPFCLLDEIEAALDEPNVDRYASYLNKLKDHTQFIVITHRRGTMEMADRLYGITMQEKGVSALVSVDLTDGSLLDIQDGD